MYSTLKYNDCNLQYEITTSTLLRSLKIFNTNSNVQRFFWISHHLCFHKVNNYIGARRHKLCSLSNCHSFPHLRKNSLHINSALTCTVFFSPYSVRSTRVENEWYNTNSRINKTLWRSISVERKWYSNQNSRINKSSWYKLFVVLMFGKI